MSAFIFELRDSFTMLRRDLRHALRFPALTITGVFMPVLFLLLFDVVFGHTLQAGIATSAPHDAKYVNYVTAGILLMTAASVAEATALSVCSDMNQGIITRLRTMSVSRSAVLSGYVWGGVLRSLLSGAAVLGVAFALGLHPYASPIKWLGAGAMFALVAFALTWVTVSFGLLARSPSGANSLALILVILPFVSNAFVPADSMPSSVRWFTAHQPFSPMIATLRGLLNGTAIGQEALIASAWCIVLSLGGYLVARSRYDQLAPAAGT